MIQSAKKPKSFMKKLIYGLLLGLLFATNLSAQPLHYPDQYVSEYYASEEKIYLLLKQPGNDVSIFPGEDIPLAVSTNFEQQNLARDEYKLPVIQAYRKVIVFVLDTEAKFVHPDLRAATLDQYSKSFTGETSYGDVNGHGIHCAGIIAGAKTGLVYPYAQSGNLRVAAVKVLRDNGTGSFSDIMAGLEYVRLLTPTLNQQGWEVVVSMSLGGSGVYEPVNELIGRLWKEGILVVAAAGNSGRSPIGTPANAPKATAVGSIDKSEKRSWFSSFGEGLWIMSYGQEIYSTYKNNTYATLNGTSMATPNQAAWYAWRIMTSKTKLTLDQVIDPKFTLDLGTEGYDLEYGYGVSQHDADNTDPGDPTDPTDPDTPREIGPSRYVYYQFDSLLIQWRIPGESQFRTSYWSPVVGFQHPYASDEYYPIAEKLIEGYFSPNRGFQLRANDDELNMANFAGRFFRNEMRNDKLSIFYGDAIIKSKGATTFADATFMNKDLLKATVTRNGKANKSRNVVGRILAPLFIRKDEGRVKTFPIP